MDMTYTEEIKAQIITRYKSKESIINISKETGIPRSTIYRWINDYKAKNSINKTVKSKEIKELERKVEKLQTMLAIIHELGISVNASLKEKLNAMAPLYGKYNVHWLCEAMQVDRGTFYNHIFRNKKIIRGIPNVERFSVKKSSKSMKKTGKSSAQVKSQRF